MNRLLVSFGAAFSGLTTVQFHVWDVTGATVLDWTNAGVSELVLDANPDGTYILDVALPRTLFYWRARTSSAPAAHYSDPSATFGDGDSSATASGSQPSTLGDGGHIGPLPFLNFCGVEVGNAARTLSYLRALDTSGHWEFGPSDVCGVLYRLDGGTCVAPEAFVSPDADPAPWHDPLEPVSDEFYGVVILDFTGYDSTIMREVVARTSGLGGGVFAAQRREPREWQFRAALIASTDEGAEYGLKWLTAVLSATECDRCSTCDMTVRLSCPPDDCSDDTIGEWVAYDTALTRGPKEVEKYPVRLSDSLGGCRAWSTVEWTMVSGNPFLYKRAADCAAGAIGRVPCSDICGFLFGPDPETVCCVVTPPLHGTLGSVVTLNHMASDVAFPNGVTIDGYRSCPLGSIEGDPDVRMRLTGVPADATVVVDAARHRVTITTVDEFGDEVVTDGQSLLDVHEGETIQWVEVRDCDDLTCICVRTTGDCPREGLLSVEIATQLREG